VVSFFLRSYTEKFTVPRDLAALRWLEAGESVILYGPVEAG
jgi:hypothetical protein